MSRINRRAAADNRPAIASAGDTGKYVLITRAEDTYTAELVDAGGERTSIEGTFRSEGAALMAGLRLAGAIHEYEIDRVSPRPA